MKSTMASQKVLITIDNSTFSADVAKYGVTLALKLNAKVAILFVADIEKANMNYETGIVSQDKINSLKNEGNAAIDQIIHEFPHVTIKRFITEGIPSKEILHISKIWGANLIVMGTHGKTGLKRMLMGSTAENTLRLSNIPILIIPHKI